MFKNIIQDKKAVLFDLDGTLVDTERFWKQAFAEILKPITNVILSENVFGQMGESLLEKWQNVIASGFLTTKITAQELKEQTEDRYIKLINESNLEPREGFWEFANELKNEKKLKIGLVTNTDKKVAEAVIKKCELENVFDITLFGNDVKKKKPNPDIYVLAAKNLGLNPKEIVVFEDSIIGATAAYGAGCSLVVIWDGNTNKNLFPEAVLYFLVDFTHLAGNLDHTYAEAFEDYRQVIMKKLQRTQKPPHLK